MSCISLAFLMMPNEVGESDDRNQHWQDHLTRAGKPCRKPQRPKQKRPRGSGAAENRDEHTRCYASTKELVRH